MKRILFSVAFLGLIYSSSAQSLCFDPASNFRYHTGTYPISSGVADFNGDGHEDVVVANRNDFNIVIFNGDGVGDFVQGATYALPGQAQEILVDDINGDGAMDIITSQLNNIEICAFMNNGAGVFNDIVPSNCSSAAAGNFHLAKADFNGDGLFDLALSSKSDNKVFILQSSGTGVFDAAYTLDVLDQPTNISCADISGDGHADIALSFDGGNTQVSIYAMISTSPLAFATAFAVEVGSAFQAMPIALGYFDADVNMDIAVAGAGDMAVALGTGGGAFATPSHVFMGAYGYDLRAEDVNSDGNIDLLWATDNTGSVHAALGNGDGTFAPFSINAAGGFSQYLSFGDFDEDGIKDVISLNPAQKNFSFLDGHDNGRFGELMWTTVHQPKDIVVDDFNHDSHLDVIAAGGFPGGFSVMLGNGDGTAQPTTTVSGVNAECMSGIDANGDAHLDLVFVTMNDVVAALGNGDGTFGAFALFSHGQTDGGERQCWVGDFNGDSNADIASVNVNLNQFFVMYGDGAGQFSAPVYISVPLGAYDVTGNDMDNDGDLDLIIPVSSQNVLCLYLNNGNGTFQAPYPYATGLSPRAAVVADWNEDGNWDMAAVNNDAQNFTITFLNSVLGTQSTGTFAFASANSPVGITAGDFNSDGHQDVVVAANSSNRLVLFLGNGDGTFQPEQSFETGVSPFYPVGADMNEDGAYDLVVANRNTNNVSVILNTQAFITANGPTAICQGESVILTASEGGSYLWNNGQTTQSIEASESGYYHCAITNQAGTCTILSTDIQVQIQLVAQVTLSEDFLPNPCSNDDGQQLQGGNPQGGTYSGSAVVNGIFYPIISGSGTFPITYSYTDPGGCGTYTSDTVYVTVRPAPVLTFDYPYPFICTNFAPLPMEGGSPSPGTYSGPNVTNGIYNDPTYSTGIFTFTYSYTSDNGCSSSVDADILVDICGGVDESQSRDPYFVYGRKEVTVYQTNGPIKVYGMNGQLVYQNVRSVGTEIISTHNWSAGVYILSTGNKNFKINVE